jgi:hypothetical protein
MLSAHGGEITADEIGELALLSLPVMVLLVVFVVLAQRARNAPLGAEDSAQAQAQPEGDAPSGAVGRRHAEGR